MKTSTKDSVYTASLILPELSAFPELSALPELSECNCNVTSLYRAHRKLPYSKNVHKALEKKRRGCAKLKIKKNIPNKIKNKKLKTCP